MSYIPLSEVKEHLRVIHSADDALIQNLLNGAENQALNFMNRTSFAELCETDSNYDSDTATMPDQVRVAIYLLVQATYEGRVAAARDEVMALTDAAERLLMPYRCEMGI